MELIQPALNQGGSTWGERFEANWYDSLGHDWHGQGWYQRWQAPEPTDSTERGKDQRSIVQGWFLFIDSGLDTMERNVLHAELKGEFGVREVEAALRKHWTDSDLKRRDEEKGRYMSNAAVVEDDEGLVESRIGRLSKLRASPWTRLRSWRRSSNGQRKPWP